jgi:uroporphyrinogen-III synthase
MNKKNVVLFRASDLPNDFQETLSQFYEIFCINVLTFTYEEYIKNFLNTNFTDFQGIVFPSPRAVIAFNQSFASLDNKEVFAVGESTATHCENLLNKRPDVVGKQ